MRERILSATRPGRVPPRQQLGDGLRVVAQGSVFTVPDPKKEQDSLLRAALSRNRPASDQRNCSTPRSGPPYRMPAKVGMTLKTIIADDEQIVRQSLKRVLSNEKDIEIVDECANGSDALASIEWHEPDLLLLDVGMPGMGGFEVLEALGRRRLPLVVLITAFDRYAIRAFEACAVDYLLKPSSPERIRNMLVRVREQLALIRRSPNEDEAKPTSIETLQRSKWTANDFRYPWTN